MKPGDLIIFTTPNPTDPGLTKWLASIDSIDGTTVDLTIVQPAMVAGQRFTAVTYGQAPGQWHEQPGHTP